MLDLKDLSVDVYTTPCPICIRPDAGIVEVQKIMQDSGVRHLPVTDSTGRILGLVSQRDLQALANIETVSPLQASDIMVESPESVSAGCLLSEAVFKMSEHMIGSLLVLDGEGKLDGIFTSTDALNALIEVLRGEVIA